MRKLMIGLLVLVSLFSLGQVSQELLNKRLKMLALDSTVYDYFDIKNNYFNLYHDSISKSQHIPYYQVRLDNIKLLYPSHVPRTIQATDKKPLNGLRIAIDPGHMAGSMEFAKIEDKYIEMPSYNASFYEAELTLATAILLKQKLEKLGATVLLTWSKPGLGPIGISLSDWIQKRALKDIDSVFKIKSIDSITYQKLRKAVANPTHDNQYLLFHKLYKHLDFKSRADKINAFKADLAVIIHYNVDEKNEGWKQPTNKNFNMYFIPGAIGKGEMSKPEQRVEFMRLLLSDDLDRSLLLSECIAKAQSNIPGKLAQSTDADYLSKSCTITPAEGVFCRNLSLSRNARTPLCYDETLYQDNTQVLELLKNKNLTVSGIRVNKIVEIIAKNYCDGILEYVRLGK